MVRKKMAEGPKPAVDAQAAIQQAAQAQVTQMSSAPTAPVQANPASAVAGKKK